MYLSNVYISFQNFNIFKRGGKKGRLEQTKRIRLCLKLQMYYEVETEDNLWKVEKMNEMFYCF